MSTDLVGLAFAHVPGHLPVAGRRPARARHRPPAAARVLDYLQLVGPAVLTAIAAVSVMVVTDDDGTPHVQIGIEWIAVLACLAVVAVAAEPVPRPRRGRGDRHRRAGDLGRRRRLTL